MNTPNPYAPPTAPVRDIPADGSQRELAGRGARLGAIFLDGIVLAVLVYVPLLATANFAALRPVNGQINFAALLAGPGPMLAGVGLLIYIAITCVLVSRNGQTVGKKLLGIKVVRGDGSRATLGRIFWLRNVIIGVVSAIPILGSAVALIDNLLIFRQSRQCLHDQIADTIVINA
jgi:uncharacterized RDD family membrane protein YckC